MSRCLKGIFALETVTFQDDISIRDELRHFKLESQLIFNYLNTLLLYYNEKHFFGKIMCNTFVPPPLTAWNPQTWWRHN